MKYLFLLIIFIIIFSSCQPTINEKSISVDIGKISSLPPETLFTSARIIPLETTDSSLMAQIDKVLVHKKTIYLLDARQNIVFVFNDNGNFLFKINQKGRGPEEYNFLNDININPYEENLLQKFLFRKRFPPITNLDISIGNILLSVANTMKTS